jgi:hypothetical protein
MSTPADLSAAPVSPLFFVSYARVKDIRLPAPVADRDEFVMRFFTDLSLNVNELVSPPTGIDPGFIDRFIGGGERWELELLEAANTCQVFVPLISPSYLRSEWCLREWEVFAARRVVARDPAAAGHETAIVPVVWVPTELSTMPATVQRIQLFSPEGLPDPQLAAQYRENGVYGLLRTKQDEAYHNVVWRLSMRVREICLRYRVEDGEQPEETG